MDRKIFLSVIFLSAYFSVLTRFPLNRRGCEGTQRVLQKSSLLSASPAFSAVKKNQFRVSSGFSSVVKIYGVLFGCLASD
jgi:hypothetical protein